MTSYLWGLLSMSEKSNPLSMITYSRPVFSLEHRIKLLQKITKDTANIEIVKLEGLLANFMI